VTLERPVDPYGERVAQGNTAATGPPPVRGVEDWLSEIERSMKSTLLAVLRKCLADISVQQRAKWLLAWPAQIVTACD
jgi:hypothetical protein